MKKKMSSIEQDEYTTNNKNGPDVRILSSQLSYRDLHESKYGYLKNSTNDAEYYTREYNNNNNNNNNIPNRNGIIKLKSTRKSIKREMSNLFNSVKNLSKSTSVSNIHSPNENNSSIQSNIDDDTDSEIVKTQKSPSFSSTYTNSRPINSTVDESVNKFKIYNAKFIKNISNKFFNGQNSSTSQRSSFNEYDVDDRLKKKGPYSSYSLKNDDKEELKLLVSTPSKDEQQLETLVLKNKYNDTVNDNYEHIYPSIPIPINQNNVDYSPNDESTNIPASHVTNETPTINSAPQPLYYLLKVNLKEGKNLAIRDIGGSSDPYVKFLLNTECVYKSKIIYRNLNPKWGEEFIIKLPKKSNNSSYNGNNNETYESNPCQNVIIPNAPMYAELTLENTKLCMAVYDYDRGFLNDDIIGFANIALNSLEENVESQLELELFDEKNTTGEHLGIISLDVKLIPKYNDDDDSFKYYELPQRSKRTNQVWSCVVNIVLLDGIDLIPMDDNGFSDPYVKFRLGADKYRSRIIKRTLNPVFMEHFQLYVYDTNKMTLFISVYDYDSVSSSDDFMGKASLDLKTIEIEKTHEIRLPLEDGAGFIRMLVTVTGTYGYGTAAELDYNKEMELSSTSNSIIREYGLANSLKNMCCVGWLQVKVLRAEGLASMDMNGKSDPFCTLQVVNQYVQTHTEYKTLCPEWGKVFEFRINDIHAVLEVTIFDEDKNKVYEFLGKIVIPIINIQNGKRKTYALKDAKLLRRTKGSVELELNLVYNPVRAIVRTFKPREVKFLEPDQKLKIPVLKQNIQRVHNLAQGVINSAKFIKSCLDWESPLRSATVLIIKANLNSAHEDEDSINFYYDDDEDESSETSTKRTFYKPNKRTSLFKTPSLPSIVFIKDDYEHEPKKSVREKVYEIQEICLKVQETLDFVASLGERVVNTLNFTVPWLSFLAIGVLSLVVVILYLIPLRYIILVYGIHRFTLKFRKPPGYIDNNELLDFLSRVPSRKEQFSYKEFKITENHNTTSLQNPSFDKSIIRKRRNSKMKI